MAEVVRDLCVQTRDGDKLDVVRVVWQLHSKMVASWVEFHRGTPPATLDLANLDGRAARAFDAWCLHDPLWKDGVTASVFGACMELSAYLLVPPSFVDELARIAFANVGKWAWNCILPFLELVPDDTYTNIVTSLLGWYQHGREGWWYHGYPVRDQRLLTATQKWLRYADDRYLMTFRLFLDRMDYQEIATFLESSEIRSQLMHRAIMNAGSRNREHLINFWKTHPSWVPVALAEATECSNKSHFVNVLKKMKHEM